MATTFEDAAEPSRSASASTPRCRSCGSRRPTPTRTRCWSPRPTSLPDPAGLRRAVAASCAPTRRHPPDWLRVMEASPAHDDRPAGPRRLYRPDPGRAGAGGLDPRRPIRDEPRPGSRRPAHPHARRRPARLRASARDAAGGGQRHGDRAARGRPARRDPRLRVPRAPHADRQHQGPRRRPARSVGRSPEGRRAPHRVRDRCGGRAARGPRRQPPRHGTHPGGRAAPGSRAMGARGARRDHRPADRAGGGGPAARRRRPGRAAARARRRAAPRRRARQRARERRPAHAPRPRGSTLSARPMDGTLVLAIDDDGPGVPAAEMEHLFDRFYRVPPVDEDARQARQGLGMGLAIARGFLEAMGGSIEAVPERVGRPRHPAATAGPSATGRRRTRVERRPPARSSRTTARCDRRSAPTSVRTATS